MVNRKMIMRTNLCEALRTLMMRKPFDKITIKHICDEANVIRATFYNYFEDKYDCLNTIVMSDIAECINFDEDSKDIIFNKIIDSIENNKEFYRVAYKVEGENGFKNMIIDAISYDVNEFLKRNRNDYLKEEFSSPFISMYYATFLELYLHDWLFADRKRDYNRLMKLLNSNFFDFIR